MQAIGLIFHGIGDPQRVREPGEERYWISTHRFEAVLDAILRLQVPDLIRISFDDGNMSDFTIALPRLLKCGLKAQFFVLTGRIDEPGSLGRGQLLELQQAGMEIGSHGVGHLDWRSLDDDVRQVEVQESRKRLQDITGRRIESVAIPFGSYDFRTLRAIRQAGYAQAYSSDRGWMDDTAFLRPRTSVRADMDDRELSDVLNGRMPLAAQLRRSLAMWRKSLPF